MNKDHFVTFAYGSNMLSARIKRRCPSARSIGVAELPGHELRWHKASDDRSGKCDIVVSNATNVSVIGVLYEIDTRDKRALDRAEGVGFGYEEIEVDVLHGQDRLRVKAYRATNTDPARRPYSWYRALVIAGAKEHRLPLVYVAQLEATPADEDPCRARHDENMALV